MSKQEPMPAEWRIWLTLIWFAICVLLGHSCHMREQVDKLVKSGCETEAKP